MVQNLKTDEKSLVFLAQGVEVRFAILVGMYCRLRTEGLERVIDATLTSKCRSPREIELYYTGYYTPTTAPSGVPHTGYVQSRCDQTSQPRCKR